MESLHDRALRIGAGLVGEHRVRGMILGIVDRDAEYIMPFGESGSDLPISGESLFDPGSVAKTLTATLLATMVATADVSLTDRVTDFLPDGVQIPGPAREMTLLDLATHFSGLPREPAEGRRADDNIYASLERVTLHAPPGRKFRYSNFGFTLLADMLARRAGREFGCLLSERVLAPLEMTSTRVRDRSKPPQAVQGFVGASSKRADPVERLPGAGGLWTSANDMVRWLRANLRPDQTVIEPAIRLAQTPQRSHRKLIALEPGRMATIGLAWEIKRDGVMFHTGGTNGFTSYCGVRPRTSRGLIALMNLGIGELPPWREIPVTARSIVRLARSVPKLLTE